MLEGIQAIQELGTLFVDVKSCKFLAHTCIVFTARTFLLLRIRAALLNPSQSASDLLVLMNVGVESFLF